MRHLFEAEHLAYRYAKGLLAVRDVSLTVTAASMTAIIGANGSGKSTLIRMLAGLLHARLFGDAHKVFAQPARESRRGESA